MGYFTTNILPWLVLICSTLSMYLLAGCRRGFGIFITELYREFNRTISLTELDWIGDTYSGLSHVLILLITPMVIMPTCVHSYQLLQACGAGLIGISFLFSSSIPNPHFLFLTYSLLNAIGSAMIFVIVGIMMSKYFDKTHNFHIFANTLISGNSVAALVIVNIYAPLLDQFGWRNTFLLLGVSYFLLLVLTGCFAIKPEDEYKSLEVTTDKHKEDDVKLHNCNPVSLIAYFQLPSTELIIKVVLLVLWGLERIFTFIVIYGLMMNLPEFSGSTNDLQTHTVTQTTTVLNMYLAGEATTYVLAFLISGLTKNILRNKLRYIMLVCTLLNSMILYIWAFYFDTNNVVSMILAFICGMTMGTSVSFQFPVGEELTGLSQNLSFSFTLFVTGFGIMVSPGFSASVAVRRSHTTFFIVQGSTMVAKAMCVVISCIILCFVPNAKENHEMTEKTPILSGSTASGDTGR